MKENSEHIYFKKGYKYQVTRPFYHKLSINPFVEYLGRYYSLSMEGVLTVHIGYAWDGSSGPTLDTKNQFRASAVHDALCQLIEEGIIKESFRDSAHKIFYDILIEDKMNKIRAKLWLYCLKKFNKTYSQTRKNQKEICAP